MAARGTSGRLLVPTSALRIKSSQVAAICAEGNYKHESKVQLPDRDYRNIGTVANSKVPLVNKFIPYSNRINFENN
jgi:hypothetical protein